MGVHPPQTLLHSVDTVENAGLMVARPVDNIRPLISSGAAF